MAIAPIFPVLLIAVITSCKCDHTSGYSPSSGNSASEFGGLLKPPPPPPLSQILPVPFHGGSGRIQQENVEVAYRYQPPLPPPPPPPMPISTDFKFPAPFYKQYNFNFVPPPQPFSTTPSPSLFQKVSTWLFPSQQTGNDIGSSVYSNSNTAPIKKDCNPCNLVPWIPVIRYNNLGAKNINQNSLPTYGPPSPTAHGNLPNTGQYRSHPATQNEEKRLPQLIPGAPHINYGPPTHIISKPNNFNSIGIASSTYGPPSPTQTIIEINSQSPPSSTFSVLNTSYRIPSLSYGLPSTSIDQPSSYIPNSSQGILTSHNVVSSTYRPNTLSYATYSPSYLIPAPAYGTPYATTSTPEPVSPPSESGIFNNDVPQESDVEILKDIEPLEEFQLPKVTRPTGFKNSYGETISNTNIFDIPYPATAIAAESTKIKTEILPHGYTKSSPPNMSVALANPAPFTVNRGRNIHTLQPVALPNLSVSPLPPIFNARPFRPVIPAYPTNIVQGINQMQQITNNVNIAQSVPLIEFTHSVDYPATFIESPIIDIDTSKESNHSKTYRNIPNSFVINDIKDISSQASEDHISATKSVPESSFESTGVDVGNYDNNIYDTNIPTGLKQGSTNPSKNKASFADLRGVKDEDVDKYRMESNLQSIDSPLLYLKPSAPHKNHGNFVLAVSTPGNDNEYEMYDDHTTAAPQISMFTNWEESRIDNREHLPPITVQDSVYQPKLVQIIVPYITNKKQEESDQSFENVPQDWTTKSEKEYQARKIPSNREVTQETIRTESYNTLSTITDEPKTTVTVNYDIDQPSPTVVSEDVYDVKEAAFDIIKLQHTIDDWTEQEYSKEYKTPQRLKSSEKHAKQIPDEYFATTTPISYVTETSENNYEFYDHEGASSIQHSVTDDSNNTYVAPRKEYNTIERSKSKPSSNKNDDVQKLHIYTAASSFRARPTTTSTTTTTTTTTPAPWGRIQTSISPLTKEKVYVVTSKPWREMRNVSNQWYAVEPLAVESKKTDVVGDASESDKLPFKSPRFINRPSFGFTSGGKVESVKSDSLYGFSRSWYQSINDLVNQTQNNSTFPPESAHTTDNYH